jgi:hypothetical protein
MKYNLQKKQVAEKIVNIINDVRSAYTTRIGQSPSQWDRATRQLFFLNCDTEIICLLEDLEFEINEGAFELGLTYGIMILEHETKSIFIERYGDMMDMIAKEKMYDEINEGIVNYISEGLGE